MIRYKMSPELGDGDNWTVVDIQERVVEAVIAWFDEFGEFEGEEFTVKTIEMSEEEVAALPEIG